MAVAAAGEDWTVAAKVLVALMGAEETMVGLVAELGPQQRKGPSSACAQPHELPETPWQRARRTHRVSDTDERSASILGVAL